MVSKRMQKRTAYMRHLEAKEDKKYNELKNWCYTQNALDFNSYY